MIKHEIINPHVWDLLSRVRHTNTIVIADCGFPFWPEIETVDISLKRGIPSVNDVLELVVKHFEIGHIWQAEQFLGSNSEATISQFQTNIGDHPLTRLDHEKFKEKVPDAIGLIRTGGSDPYSNLIIESA